MRASQEEEKDEDEGERRQKEGNGLQPTQVKADGRIGESEGMEGREWKQNDICGNILKRKI